jgi:hypothetical protein
MSDKVTRFVAGALVAVGGMMVLLCGGCGAIFLVMFVVGGLTSSNKEDLWMAAFPLVLGGLPALVGLGLFVGGRSLARRGQPSPPPPPSDDPPDQYDRGVHP